MFKFAGKVANTSKIKQVGMFSDIKNFFWGGWGGGTALRTISMLSVLATIHFRLPFSCLKFRPYLPLCIVLNIDPSSYTCIVFMCEN